MPKGSAVIEPLLRVTDVVDWLGVSAKSIYRWCEEGRMPFVRAGTSLRFRRADVEAWIQQAAERET